MSKPSVLLIAQSKHSAKSIAKLLQGDFSVADSNETPEAWKLIQSDAKIVLIICELCFAVDDFRLIQRIRNASEHRLAALPVLLLVNEKDSDSNRAIAFRSGATDFINLPFTSSELVVRVSLHANQYLQQNDDSTLVIGPDSEDKVLHQIIQQNTFNSRLEQEWAFSFRHKTYISICKVKLDKLNELFAQFDKTLVNSILRQVSIIFQKTVRREDSLCYSGEGEFFILYPATNSIGAACAINRFVKKIGSSKFAIDDKHLNVTLSAAIFGGIANDYTNISDVLKIIEKGLAGAVKQGGNCVVNTKKGEQKLQISIDRALQLIARNDTESLDLNVREMVLAVLPLLEFADQTLNIGLKLVSQKLMQRLADLPDSE